MGFSVSGSAAIVFAGMFIAFGAFYTATSNNFERVSDARDAQSEAYLDTKNTDVTVVETTYDADADVLTVAVNNTGSEALVVDHVDVLVDGTYQTSFVSRTVDGEGITPSSETDLLAPGEQLTVEIDVASQPDRVKVVSGPGVSAFSDTVVLV
jgi:flagellar protein FlaF